MNKEKNLPAWTECVGRFRGIDIGESEVSVILSCGREHIILSFPTENRESQMLQQELSSCKPGTKLALMKTDESLLIRR